VSRSVRAIRGATTLDDDTPEQMVERVTSLLSDMFDRNRVGLDDVVSIFFTVTDDLHCMFPATAARTMATVMAEIPLMCARELAITGGMPRCVRVMAHVETSLPRAAIEHIYHGEARSLRPDIGTAERPDIGTAER
jgi:chorismate mutase